MSHSDRKKFKPWFMAAVAFGLWAVSMDFVWTRFVINGITASETARLGHLIREHGSEIPIFGASRAYTDYVPEILGDDVYNYGMYGVSLDVLDAWLQIECKKTKHTPIVLDMNAPADRELGDPSKYPPFARLPEIRQLLDRTGRREWRYWVPGLRYFGYYDWYLQDYLSEHLSPKKKTVYDDAIPLPPRGFDHILRDEDIKRRLQAGYGFRSLPDQDSLLFEVIKSTPRRTVIIVYAPLHSSCFANFKDPEGFARYLDKLRSFPNVVLLNWSRMELPDDCFSDTLHLNAKGAQEFSRRLAGVLRTIRAAAIADTNSPGPAAFK